MYKSLLLCAFLIVTQAGHVRKSHQPWLSYQFQGSLYDVITQIEHWAQIISDEIQHQSQAKKKHPSLVQTNEQYIPGVVGQITDLSNNVGIYSYTVTDINGNILEQDAGDHLPKQFYNAYLQMTQEIEKGPAMIKLQTDLDNIIRLDQLEQEKKEQLQTQALERTDLSEQQQ